MANLAGSKKRARQTVSRNQHNAKMRAQMRTHIKKVRYAIDRGDKKSAAENFLTMQKVLDRAVGKRLIHKNNAARKKSQLNARIKAL